MQDKILREIIVKASKDKVYTAVTNPEQLIKWFPNAIEGSLEVGQQPILDFGEYGRNQIYIESAKPFDYFAYRWMPGSNHLTGDVLSRPNTLVEFILEESNGMTTIKVQESGFAALPAEIAEKCFEDNSGGWEYMIGRLEKLLNG